MLWGWLLSKKKTPRTIQGREEKAESNREGAGGQGYLPACDEAEMIKF